MLLLRSPPPSPSSSSFPLSVISISRTIASPFPIPDFDSVYPGPVLVSWRLRPGRPSGPSSRAGFPLRPRSPERVWGSVGYPVDLPRHHLALSSRAPGCGGHFARCREFAGAGGVCRSLPCGSRGWHGVRGLTPSPYPVGCPRGGTWAAALDGPRHRGFLRRTVWPFSAIRFGGQGYILRCPSLRRDLATALSYLVRL